VKSNKDYAYVPMSSIFFGARSKKYGGVWHPLDQGYPATSYCVLGAARVAECWIGSLDGSLSSDRDSFEYFARAFVSEKVWPTGSAGVENLVGGGQQIAWATLGSGPTEGEGKTDFYTSKVPFNKKLQARESSRDETPRGDQGVQYGR
jgi:hypothetical protein